MKILVTAATDYELQFIDVTDNITVVNTGIGISSTVYNLTKLFNCHFDLALNVGIAGGFSGKTVVGDVVTVYSEVFGDFGIAAQNGFLTCFEKNLLSKDLFPFQDGRLISERAKSVAESLDIPCVKGVTNNTVSGEKERIRAVSAKFSPDIETMEGAAFFYVCLLENVPFVEIRSISNLVEPRDESKWNIPLAVKNLSEKVNLYIKQIDG
ncbi:MAG: futalosine hydrolase [Prevotellaceae bacterium]|jgi:futalosine hydrolase|nr:futalosine hydrolase [Prevotellaceae bacterium]